MKHFPTPVTVMQLWLSLFWKPFFPALFPYGSYFSYEQQASLPFTLNCPRQPPVEMHWANKGVRVARCSQQCHWCPCHFPTKSHSSGNGSAPDIYTGSLTPHSAIYCYIFLTHSHWKLTRMGLPCPATHRCQCSWAAMKVRTKLITPADAGTQEWFCLRHQSQSFPPMSKPQNKYSKSHSNLMVVSKLLNMNISYHKSKFKLQQTI